MPVTIDRERRNVLLVLGGRAKAKDEHRQKMCAEI